MTYLTQFFLLILGLGFMAFGVHSFFDPNNLVVAMGADKMSNEGIYELRSIYGGTSIGGGLLLLVASFRESLQRPALYFIIAYMGGYAFARLGAVQIDGMPSTRLLIYWALEVICAVIAILFVRKLNA